MDFQGIGKINPNMIHIRKLNKVDLDLYNVWKSIFDDEWRWPAAIFRFL